MSSPDDHHPHPGTRVTNRTVPRCAIVIGFGDPVTDVTKHTRPHVLTCGCGAQGDDEEKTNDDDQLLFSFDFGGKKNDFFDLLICGSLGSCTTSHCAGALKIRRRQAV